MRQRAGGVDTLVGGGVHVHAGPSGLEHAVCRGRDPVPIHPVEGLGEGDEPEHPEPGGEVLGPEHLPAHVPQRGACGQSLGLGDHPRVGVDPDRLGDQRSQQQGQRAGPQPTSSSRPDPSRPSSAASRSARARG